MHVGVVTGVCIKRTVSEFILVTNTRNVAHHNGSNSAAKVDTTHGNTSYNKKKEMDRESERVE